MTKEQATQKLLDRTDYRNTLIHRIEELQNKLKSTEEQISALRKEL